MKRINKLLLLLLGMFFVMLGAVGMFLPVLPTVPFLLVALWCFARSSEKFHQWLYHHHMFGPVLQQWEKYKVIPFRAKFIAITSMVISAAYVIFFTYAPIYVIILMLAFMGYGIVFILTKPSIREEK